MTTNISTGDIISIATLSPSKHPTDYPSDYSSQSSTHTPTGKPSQSQNQAPSIPSIPSITSSLSSSVKASTKPSANSISIDTARASDTAKKNAKWKWDSSLKDARRNIIFILTDDQDILMSGLTSFNKTMKMIYDISNDNNINNYGSLVFKNAFVNTPVCCVSRATILTGRYPQNTQTLTYVHKVLFFISPADVFGQLRFWRVQTLCRMQTGTDVLLCNSASNRDKNDQQTGKITTLWKCVKKSDFLKAFLNYFFRLFFCCFLQIC